VVLTDNFSGIVSGELATEWWTSRIRLGIDPPSIPAEVVGDNVDGDGDAPPNLFSSFNSARIPGRGAPEEPGRMACGGGGGGGW